MLPSPKTARVDVVRKFHIQDALREAKLDAIACVLPSDVLLLTGYWPVVGASVAICFRDGPTQLIVPKDEEDLAEAGFADCIQTFTAESLDETGTIVDAVRPHLLAAVRDISSSRGTIGIEVGESSQASSYLAMHLFGNGIAATLHEIAPPLHLIPADQLIQTLKSQKTPMEIEKIRGACGVANDAFELGAPQLRAGIDEAEAAELFRARLTGSRSSRRAFQRCDGFAFCMSGPNAAKACAAYARTRNRTLQQDDTIMIHCNSYVDGFWTDITRTYTLDIPDRRQNTMREAVLAARAAALDQIQPGAKAANVDAASRQVIQQYGLGEYLKHGTGHGVGFSPMSPYSLPKLHGQSSDTLKEGMVFNVEPAVYIDEFGGMRHCDMVAVTNAGYELLTDFQTDAETLTVANNTAAISAGSYTPPS